MSCCIIIPLITLTCNRVTAQHKQTRPSSGILLCPFLYFSICFISSVSFILPLLYLPLFFSLCQGRSCPRLLNPSRGFVLTCALQAERQSDCHTVYSVLSLTLTLSLSVSLKCHAALTPFHCLYQSMNFLKVITQSLLLVFPFFSFAQNPDPTKQLILRGQFLPISLLFFCLCVQHMCILSHCSWIKQSPWIRMNVGI